MGITRVGFIARGRFVLVAAVSAFALAACANGGSRTAEKKPSRSKEYFAESEYGVKASPRVTHQASGLPRGGGRDQIGRPYQVRGKWYHPREQPDYRNTGLASWYGDAFHGRLTANGEIYDMTHLTAAHPTMPLPSYARVTNKKNGSSVIVRVNDRGPFHGNRIIDLSKRAAEMLDYTHSGVAQVDVEYLGRAPLHGQDDHFLMASYRPAGGRGPGPSDGLPTGVMVAMAGPTPQAPARMPAPTPQAAVGGGLAAFDAGVPTLPAFAPIAPERPGAGERQGSTQLALSYADERVQGAASAFAALETPGRLSEQAVLRSWKARHSGASRVPAAGEHIVAGSFASEAEALEMSRRLSALGRTEVATDFSGRGFSLTLHADGRLSLDEMLRGAWSAGASDAMTIR